MKKIKIPSPGFTLIEVIIVLAIISIIAAMSILSWQSFSDSVALGNTAKMIEAKIKLARSYSLSALDDKKYGIRFEADKVTLFDADTPADITPSYNLTDGVEIYDATISNTGGGVGCNNNIAKDNGELGVDCGGGGCDACSAVFNRLIGNTANVGSIGIRMINRPTKIKNITINSQGQTGTDSFEASTVSPINDGRHVHFNLASWTIQNSATTTKLIFRKNDGVPGTLIGTEIDTAAFFTAGIFNWEGTVTVDTVEQKLRIHTLDTDGDVLCVIRDRMQNNKDLKISFFSSGSEKGIVVYDEDIDGTVAVTSNITYVDEMLPQ